MAEENEKPRESAEQRLLQAAGDDRTPTEIADTLERYCVGQDDVVTAMSVVVFQHLARCRHAAGGMPIISHTHIPPVLLIGPSGCGKTTLMRAIGKITSLPVYIADATRLTEDGYVGESASDWIRGLLTAAEGHRALAEHGIIMIDEIDKCRATMGPPGGSNHRDVSGSGAQEALLHILSGGTAMVDVTKRDETGPRRHIVPVRTGHMMVVAAGAFDGLETIVRMRVNGKPKMGLGQRPSRQSANININSAGVEPDDLVRYGLHRQLVGRLEKCLLLNPLTDEALRRILLDAHDGPIQTQQRLAMRLGFRFEFSQNLIDLIVSEARASGLGARSLWGLVSAATERAWYEVPDRRRDEKQYPWGRTAVQLRVDSLTDGYYGLTATDRIILADSEEGRKRTFESATADAT